MVDSVEKNRRAAPPPTPSAAGPAPAVSTGAAAPAASTAAADAKGDRFTGHAAANKFTGTDAPRGVPPPPQADGAQRQQERDAALTVADLQRDRERVKV